MRWPRTMSGFAMTGRMSVDDNFVGGVELKQVDQVVHHALSLLFCQGNALFRGHARQDLIKFPAHGRACLIVLSPPSTSPRLCYPHTRDLKRAPPATTRSAAALASPVFTS